MYTSLPKFDPNENKTANVTIYYATN